MQIKFSHEYPKLWRQKKAELITVRILNAQAIQINKDLLEYDTKYLYISKVKTLDTAEDVSEIVSYTKTGYYQLPKEGQLIQLVFLGDKDIPFCTLRSFNDEKFKYYCDSVGKVFDIIRETDKGGKHD